METFVRVPVSGVPERSLRQRREALARGNAVRSYRAELKVRMKAGEVSPLDVLRDVMPEVETMRVYDLLVAVPKCGRVKVNKLLGRARIAPSKTVGGLSPRQRLELMTMVEPYLRRPQRMV